MQPFLATTAPRLRAMPALHCGEADGRYIDCTKRLGPLGDSFPSLSVLSVAISRVDNLPVGAGDLQLSGQNALDATGLVPTFGFIAPASLVSPGHDGMVWYRVTLTANRTAQQRLFIRDCLLPVSPELG